MSEAVSPRRHAASSAAKEKKGKKSQKIYLKALEDYQAKDHTELTLKKGQIIKFKGRDESGYLEGAHLGEKKPGFFPAGIVVEVTRDGAPVPNSQFAQPMLSPRAAIVRDSALAKKDETKELLAKHLETRPDKSELVDRHIFQPSKLSPELFDAQHKLEQAKTKDFLANFLRSKEQNREPLLTETAVDEFVLAMSDLTQGIPLGKHSKKLKSFDECFTGKQAVEWLIERKHCEDKPQAVATMSFLLESGVFTAVNNKKKPFKSSRLFRHTINLKDQTILNLDKTWHSKGRNAVEVSTYLLGSFLELVAKFKRPNGSVDFDTMRKSSEFKKVSLATAELQKVELTPLSNADKEVFFVNVSNLLTLHAHAKRGVPTTMLARKAASEELKYIIDGLEFSIKDIEAFVFAGKKSDTVSDKRLTHALDLSRKPLFLFGLSDGTATTPFFTCFTGKDYQQKLKDHAREFLQTQVQTDHDHQSITYPYLVQRMHTDFKLSDEDIHALLLEYLPEKEKKFFDQIKEFGAKAEVKYTQRTFTPNYLP